MKEKTHTDRFFERFSLFIILFAAMTLIGFFILDSRDTNNQNNGYVRVINCILTVPASTRTESDITKCYEQVEKDLNLRLERYNNAPK